MSERMCSRMVIDRIEGHFAVCEVELVDYDDPIRESNPFDIETQMMDVSLTLFEDDGYTAVEQGEYIVYHDSEEVLMICDMLS